MISNIDLNSLHQKLSSIHPADIDASTFLQLVEILDGKLQTEDNKIQAQLLFKLSDKLLTDFSKAPNSWETVFQILQTEGVTDSQYFQAANIFKNKLKIDLVTIKGSIEAVNSIKHNLL